MRVALTENPIDPSDLLTVVAAPEAGATVLFVGTTRQFTGDKETAQLAYEAYRTMAEQQLHLLCDEAATRWPLTGCAVVHRLGEVPIGQASVAIAVSSPHRADAYAASQWLIDTLKEQVPIWKEECFADGTREWVHPIPNDQEASR